jgi:hypothetical protein
MIRSTLKSLHRRTLSFANTTIGFGVLLLIIWSLSFEMIWVLRPHKIFSGSLRGAIGENKNFTDNIGNYNADHLMAYEPIDVVYTWVNGSDEKWLSKKRQYIKTKVISISDSGNGSSPLPVMSSGHGTTSNRTLPEPAKNETLISQGFNSTQIPGDNGTDTNVDADVNRYRDSGELRYSIRSLVKYAPWIRRIYLVTDNQIPNWLNLENDRIKVVSHEEIFPNRSHLPVFSSPAIEAHLHRIPGLSNKFIYFNDDVFLGAPTSPEDFTSVMGIQKFHFSWDVPKCAPGCSDAWIGDGFCDRACNVSACGFDYPDCVNVTAGNYGYYSSSLSQDNGNSATFCSKGCPDSWLGDKVCDTRCNNAECAWDMGDCGVDKVLRDFHGITLQRGADKRNRMAVPFGTKAAFFDLSSLNVSVEKIAHNTSDVLRNAFLLKKHNLLLFTFETIPNEDDESPDVQRNITFQLVGEDLQHANRTWNTSFVLHVVPNLSERYATLGFPNDTGKVSGYASSCLSRKSEHAPIVKAVDLSDRAFSAPPLAGMEAGDQGFAITVSVPSGFADNALRTDELYVSVTAHRGAATLRRVVNLCEAVGTVTPVSEGFQLIRKYSPSKVLCPAYFGSLIQDQNSTLFHRNIMSRNDPNTQALPKAMDGVDLMHLTLLVPLPANWGPEVEWVQTKVDLLNLNHSVQSWATERTHLGSTYDSKMCITATVKWGGDTIAGKLVSKNTTDSPIVPSNTTSPSITSNGTETVSMNSTSPELPSNFSSISSSSPLGWTSDTTSAPPADNEVEEEEDTYAKSLIHVNRLYTKKFGAINRKVPAHMPHMIDRQAVKEMQREWPEEWERTSAHRTRSSQDMQYSFAYYHYVVNRNKARKHDIRRFIKHEIDTNHDGFIDDNEFRTLTKVMRNDNVSLIRECLFNVTSNDTDRRKPERHVVTEMHEHDLKRGKVVASFEVSAYPTIDQAMNCDLVVTGLRENMDWDARFPTHIVGADGDIAFEMLGDNFTESLHQLDSIRSRQSKFICINDNMRHPSPELVTALHDFFESYWPFPSVFELSRGSVNRYLHLDEHKAALARDMEKTNEERAWSFLGMVLQTIEEVTHKLYTKCRHIMLKWLLSVTTDLISILENMTSGASDDDGGPPALKGEISSFRVKTSTASPVISYRELASISSLCLFVSLLVVCLFRYRNRASNQVR